MPFLHTSRRPRLLPILGASALIALAGMASADQVILDDLIVDGSTCTGLDCVNGESFGFDTLRLKENNLRIHFDDTSASSSFPNNDWRIVINETTNGGASFLGIGDSTAGRIPFRVDAGAPNNALRIDSAGEVGIGTANPIVELHVVDGDSPTLRLEQNGSSGFTPQTWDIAGNETNFFVRNGGKLPFRIQPNTPESALYLRPAGVIVNEDGFDLDLRVESDTQENALFVDGETGRIGMGTGTPTQLLHIQTNAANTDAFALFDANAAGSDAAFLLRQNGTVPTTWEFRNQQGSGRLNVGIVGGNTPLKIDHGAANNLLKLGINGNPDAVVVTGQLLVNNTLMNVPDYVFGDDYALRPLSEVQAFIDANSHLPEVPSEAEIMANGVDMTAMQMTLLKKIEELTLYALAQEQRIAAFEARDAEVAALVARLARIEAEIAR